ncbi:MAG: hypothetical protein GF320_04970 [Armatimonadia bacterium]|nr:hypothetical protein [Armatimonadia bacterium]
MIKRMALATALATLLAAAMTAPGCGKKDTDEEGGPPEGGVPEENLKMGDPMALEEKAGGR